MIVEPGFEAALAAACARGLGAPPGRVEGLQRLSGGASMETWAFSVDGQPLVLRRSPGGRELDREAYSSGALTLAGQAALMQAAARAGVRVPAVRMTLQPDDGLGEGFVMALVAGETLPPRILGQPAFARAEGVLTRDCARELARIHAIDLGANGPAMPVLEPAAAVAQLSHRLTDSGARLPVLELALGWLERHAPPPVPPVVLHGDFRMGNLLIDADGIAAVLDWELAHRGDPAQDLGYLCTPSWRFTRPEREVGGFGEVDALLAAYTAESGRVVEPARLRFWMAWSTVWWGLTCLAMGRIWRDGRDRSLERLVVARRLSEVEVDLLVLLEPVLAPVPRPRLAAPATAAGAACGEVAAGELLAGLGEWAQSVASAATAARARFEARVAANAATLLQREATLGPSFAAAQQARLQALGTDVEGLCQRLRRDGLAGHDGALWDHLRLTALERLAIDQPRYPGGRVARARWCLPEPNPEEGP